VLTDPFDADEAPFAPNDRKAAHDWYLAERANLLAVARAAAQARLDEICWQLAACLQTLQGAHGDTDDRLILGELGLQAALRLGDRRAEARMRQALGFALKAAGRNDRALERHREALEIFTAQDDRLGVVEALNSIGLIHLRYRQLDDAADRFEHTARLSKAANHRAWHAVALDNLAHTRLEQGLLEQAIQLAEQAMRAHRELGTEGAPLLETLLTLIRAQRESGQLDLAESYVRSAEQIFASGARNAGLEVDLALERAAIKLRRGEAEDAGEIYLNCLRLQNRLTDPSRDAATYSGIGETLSAQGRAAEAIDFHRRAVAARRPLPDGYRLGRELVLLADCLDAVGQAEEAQALRAEAAESLRLLGDPRARALHSRLSASMPAPPPLSGS
jgi:tetratricopeptide (TPR) repeat protein